MAGSDKAIIRRQLERMIAEGHVLGNHTADHPDLDAPDFRRGGLSATGRQFARLEARIDQLLGRHYPMQYLRPPFGVRGNDGHGIGERMSLPGRVDELCRLTGQNIILWHINSLDFLLFGHPGDPGTLTMDQVVTACLQRIQASRGGVVLCHANARTPELLRRVLSGLDQVAKTNPNLSPWQYVTVAELLKIKYGTAD